jgi:arylformamidase
MSWEPKLIDLTRPMTRDTIGALAGKIAADPDSPYAEVKLSYLRSWQTDNGTLCQWTLNDHFGTHVDAPIHMVEGAPAIDQVDIGRLIGEAVVVDLSQANGRGITAGDLEAATPAIQRRDIVLIYSAEQAGSFDEFITTQTFVTPEAATWLVDRGVKAVGVQAFSFEHLYEALIVKDMYNKASPPPHFPAHRIALSNGVYIIEGLGNLERVVGKRVHFAALPLPVPGSSGSPVRAVAWEES